MLRGKCECSSTLQIAFFEGLIHCEIIVTGADAEKLSMSPRCALQQEERNRHSREQLLTLQQQAAEQVTHQVAGR